MASRSGTWVRLIFTLALAMPARSGGSSTMSPVVIDISENCAVVADAAVPWLSRRSVKVKSPDHCGDQAPCRYSLVASKLRSAHGNYILNFNGRYVKGGKWYSMLTAPNVTSWEGEMVLTPKNRQACSLALNFVFHTTVSDQVLSQPTYSDRIGTESGAPDFVPTVGPRVQSNRRLEREYGQVIATRVARMRGSPVTSKPTSGKSGSWSSRGQ
jgi:hypothetical protein